MTESPYILDSTTLRKITGYDRPGDIERCLRDQGVRYFQGKNGPWTTVDLVNAAGGLINYRDVNQVDVL